MRSPSTKVDAEELQKLIENEEVESQTLECKGRVPETPTAKPTFHFTSPSAVPGPRARTVHGVTQVANRVLIDASE